MRSNKKRPEENGQKSTIQHKLLTKSISIITISLLLVGGVSSYMNYRSTVDSLEQTMTETVELAADTITREIEGYERLVYELTYNPILNSDSSTREEMSAECDRIAARNGLSVVSVTDVQGVSKTTGISVADRDYFQIPGQTGEVYVSDPVIRKDTGEMNIFISAPVRRDNKFDGILFIGIDAGVLCEIVNEIQIGETGNASIISSRGDTIGYSDVQLVLDAYNTQEELKNDPQLEQLAAIERRVMAGESDFGEYSYGGVGKYAAFTPVEKTPGWGIYVAVAKSEFLASTYMGLLIVLILLVAATVSGILLMTRTALAIVRPVKACVERIRLLAEGDIHTEVPRITTGDETQVLADSMGILVGNMGKVIGDIDYCLKELSGGDFTVASRAEGNYVGDFENILISMRSLKKTLSETLIQMMEAAEQVSLGADQMSQNAQGLAEGATEQAGAVEELTAAITNVTEIARTSAESAEEAYQKVEQATREAEGSSKDMEELREAMERINVTSRDIQNIIATIEDIASQTNLLSLNASIEAARAGEAGRGFAVVAEQIGKLAADSAQSAVNTRELIIKSLEEVENGNSITDKAAQTFEAIIEHMRGFGEIANGVTLNSVKQAEDLKEIETGVEQISIVVQSNSAAAEETSATSEELSAQSENLNELISRFRCEQ